MLKLGITRLWRANRGVYRTKKVWWALHRQGIAVARCTVERLMRDLGLKGEARGQGVRTIWSDPVANNPLDRVNRNLTVKHPNQIWVANFTFVSTWQGFAYVAFIVDVFSRFIVGWVVSCTMKTDFVIDALEQALYARQPERSGLIYHSDRGSQYVSICYSERLLRAIVEPSVGSTGDSYDNALAETTNGLYKTELVRKKGPWKTVEALE